MNQLINLHFLWPIFSVNLVNICTTFGWKHLKILQFLTVVHDEKRNIKTDKKNTSNKPYLLSTYLQQEATFMRNVDFMSHRHVKILTIYSKLLYM